MTPKILRLVLFVLFAAPLMVFAEVPQYRGRDVGNIDIVVHKAAPGSVFDPDAVRARLKTKVGEPFSQLDFDEDLKNLSADFDRIEPKLELADDKISITLDLWPKSTIRAIRWKGNRHVKDSRLLRELGLKPGALYERHEFNLAFNKVRTYFVRKGFFEAELSYSVTPDPSTNEVDIEITIDEGQSGHIERVAFSGFSKKEEQEILDIIATRKYNLFSWATGTGSFSEEAAEQDRFIILNYLHNQGYADAQVDMHVHESPSSWGIVVVFIAEKGPQYSFGTVNFSGNELFDNERLTEMLRFTEGDTFSPDKLRDAQKNISDLYGVEGYVEAIVNFEPHVVPGEQRYNIDFTIQEGEQFRIGMVRIFGQGRTQERVILHESLIEPGAVFDIRQLQRTEERLRNIGYFESVNVYPVIPKCCPCPIDDDYTLYDEALTGMRYRDVYVEVNECSTGSFGLFFGYSTQDSGFTGIELSERNFNYEGIPRIFREGLGVLRGGGEFARIRANLGKRQTSLLGQWAKPYFLDTCWVVGFDIERSWNRRISRAYDLENLGLRLHANYPISRCLRGGYHYRLRYAYTDADDNANAELRRQAANNGTISAVGVSLSYDTTNFCNTRGLYSAFEGEYAGVLGDFDFLRFTFANTFYYPLLRLGILKLRGDFRTIVPIWDQAAGKIPLNERFFLGGESTVRGYRPYSIGPQILGTDDPEGGLTSVLLSAEVNRCLMNMVDVFVFFDAGYVARNSLRLAPLRASVGAGVRLKLMGQMPITIGYGYPINPQQKDDRQGIFFSVGGNF